MDILSTFQEFVTNMPAFLKGLFIADWPLMSTPATKKQMFLFTSNIVASGKKQRRQKTTSMHKTSEQTNEGKKSKTFYI